MAKYTRCISFTDEDKEVLEYFDELAKMNRASRHIKMLLQKEMAGLKEEESLQQVLKKLDAIFKKQKLLPPVEETLPRLEDVAAGAGLFGL